MTAIAPTYTINNKKEKNSAPNNNNIKAILQNVSIKNRTEYIAFDKLITIIDEIIANV